jgi:phage-related protein
MIVSFNPHDSSDFYEEYYARQVGDGLAVFSGRPIMDGDGLGSFLGGVLKAVSPTLKNIASSAVKSIGKQALNVVGDVASGKNFKTSALNGLKNVGNDVMSDVFQAVNKSSNKNRKRGNSSRRQGGSKKKKQRSIFDR